MGLTVGELTAYLSLDNSSFERTLGSSSSGMSKLSTAAVTAAVGIGAAFAGGAAYSLLKFGDFQQGMNEIFTLLPGISQDAMDAMSQDVQDFSREFAVLPDKVIPGLYQALSAGVPKDNVFEFLGVAQRAAVAGVTDLETAVNGITGVINNYGAETITATEAADLMFNTVKNGKVTFEDLSNNLAQVLPYAAAAGVDFETLSAMITTMVAKTGDAPATMTQLKQAFVELADSGSEVGSLFEELSGQTFRDFMESGGDVGEALRMLDEHAENSGLTLDQLFGSVEAGAAALLLSGENADDLATQLDNAAGSAGGMEEAYETMAQGVNYWIDKLKAWFAVAVIDIGEKVADIGEALAGFASRVEEEFDLSGKFDEFSEQMGGLWDAIRDRAQAAMPGIRAELGEFAKFLKSDVLPAIQLIGDQFEDAWKRIKEAIEEIDWEQIKTDLESIREQVNQIAEQFGGWSTIATVAGIVVVGALAMVSEAAAQLIWLVGALIGLFGALAKLSLGALQGQINAVKNAVSTAWDWVKKLWDSLQGLGKIVLSALSGQIKGLLGPLGWALDAARDLQSTLASLKVPDLSFSVGPIKIGKNEAALGGALDGMMSVAGNGATGTTAAVGGAATTSSTYVEYNFIAAHDVADALAQVPNPTKRAMAAAFLEGRT